MLNKITKLLNLIMVKFTNITYSNDNLYDTHELDVNDLKCAGKESFDFLTQVTQDYVRNELIMSYIDMYYKLGKRIVCLSTRIQHIEFLAEYCKSKLVMSDHNKVGVELKLMPNNHYVDDKNVRLLFTSYNSGKVLFNCKCKFDVILLCMPGTVSKDMIQHFEWNPTVEVVEICDTNNIVAHHKQKLDMYKITGNTKFRTNTTVIT